MKENKEFFDGLEPVDPADVVPPERVHPENMPLDALIDYKAAEDQSHPAGEPKGYRLGPPKAARDYMVYGKKIEHHFKELESGLDGIQPGLYVIGADSNIGKTAIMVNLCLALIENNVDLKCLYLSIDDPRGRILNRIYSNLSGIELTRIDKALESEKLRDKEGAAAKVQGWYPARFDLPAINPGDKETTGAWVERAIEAAHKDAGGRLAVFIDGVNYLEISPGEKSDLQRERELAGVLKEWAKRYNAPIITTAEVRKATGEKREPDGGAQKPKRLTIHDLAGAARLAFLADAVIMLWPADPAAFDDYAGEGTVEVKAYIAKNKLGFRRGDISLDFDKSRARMRESVIDQAVKRGVNGRGDRSDGKNEQENIRF